MSGRPRVFTWHVHGTYLYYLCQAACDFYVPVKPGKPEGYGGRAGTLPWPENLHEVPAEAVRHLEFDCVLFQSERNYFFDQYEVLSPVQRRLPKVYLEHNTPTCSPTETRHAVDDPNVLLVHVTHFNRLMWDSGPTPTRVIEHGVLVPEDIVWTGHLPRGVTVANNIASRGRRLGWDVFQEAALRVPLDLIGMGSQDVGGLGEMSRDILLRALPAYRFFFNPIRYTSLPLSVCEAMALGLPVVGLATTELTRTVENGVSGYVDTKTDDLIDFMELLIRDRGLAQQLSRGAKAMARERFSIHRFAREWTETLAEASGRRPASPTRSIRNGGP
ncbi:MAG TPA: glycosyltransferase family 4 protein [Dehalococcoidia bacterium]|nr:glycosyltransferase family 4 protein [Dehalococcoidia bacterium]